MSKEVITVNMVNRMFKMYEENGPDSELTENEIAKVIKPAVDRFIKEINSDYYDKLFEKAHCDFKEVIWMYFLESCFRKDELMKRFINDPYYAWDILFTVSDGMELIIKDLCTEAAYKKLQESFISEYETEEE